MLEMDDWEEWKENPITKKVFNHIRDTIVGLKNSRSTKLENCLGLMGNDKFQEEQRLVFESGSIATMEDILNLDASDIP